MTADESSDKRSMKGWGHYLGEPDKLLTESEMRLHAALATHDRLAEMVVSLGDMQVRLCRIELWMENNVPGYEPGAHKRYLEAALFREEQERVQQSLGTPHASGEEADLRELESREAGRARSATPLSAGRGRAVGPGAPPSPRRG